MVPMDCAQECAGFFHFSHRWPGGRAEVCNGLPGVETHAALPDVYGILGGLEERRVEIVFLFNLLCSSSR